MSDDIVVVGSPAAYGAGAVHVYRLHGLEWTLEAVLHRPGPFGMFGFGDSVAASPRRIVVGATADTGAGPVTGAVHVFDYDGGDWHHVAQIAASDGASEDSFGHAVATDGAVIVVGAWLHDTNGIDDGGAAYVFRENDGQWTEEAKLTDDDLEENDLFGESVAVGGGVALVGAKVNDDAGFGTGAAFVYRHVDGAWRFEKQLQAPDAKFLAWFGISVSLSSTGMRAVVGAPQDDGQTGAAYTFFFDGVDWQSDEKLLATDPVGPWPFFGDAVAMNGEGTVVVVGAPGDRARGVDAGAVHVFRRETDGWLEVAKLSAADTTSGDRLGTAVAAGKGRAVASAPAGDIAGTAYVFHGLIGFDCNGNDQDDECDVITGASKDENANGVPDECEGVGDIDGDGLVGYADVLLLLVSWGPCPDESSCPADLNDDLVVDIDDLFLLLLNWT